MVKKEIRRSFDHVNNQRWDDAAKGLTPNAYHWVAGDHALGGKQSVKQWFEGMGRVFPKLHIADHQRTDKDLSQPQRRRHRGCTDRCAQALQVDLVTGSD